MHGLKSKIARGVAAGLFSFIAWPAISQEAVGKFIMSIGEVQIQRGDTTIPGRKNVEIQEGDVIVTGSTSNAQIRFKDGAISALRSNTEFSVKEYKFNGKADGTEKASVGILKGGVRTVTGVIGRTNRDNLKVDAVVATVGIRGTGFNITFCGPACKAANPNAKEGMYGGVFEGKIDVANKGGTSSELGVNRFIYVEDEGKAPRPLIEPPTFLKDSLEGQVRVAAKAAQAQAAAENALNDSNAVKKSPTDPVVRSPVEIPLPFQSDLIPLPEFLETRVGAGSLPPGTLSGSVITVGPNTFLRAAEFAPRGQNDAGSPLSQITLNRQVTNYEALTSPSDLQVIDFNSSAYSIKTPYTARWVEGGRDSGAVAWGRWAGGDAKIGNYQTITLEEHQGWHYLFGLTTSGTFGSGPSDISGSKTFNLIGGTSPTELRAGAQPGWRLTGGSITVDFSSKQVLAGLLQLYALQSVGIGGFDMRWSGALVTNAADLNSFNALVTKTSGNTPYCASGCQGSVYLGFYGGGGTVQPTNAGITYQFNTGGGFDVQGVAVYK